MHTIGPFIKKNCVSRQLQVFQCTSTTLRLLNISNNKLKKEEKKWVAVVVKDTIKLANVLVIG